MTMIYKLYGLSLGSNRPLPGLLPAEVENPIDVELTLLETGPELRDCPLPKFGARETKTVL